MANLDVLDWEEGIFRGLKSLYDRWVRRPVERELSARQVLLPDLRVQLMLFARMVAGQDVQLFETDHALLNIGERVCLPPRFVVARSVEGNRALYELKTLLAAVAIREGFVGADLQPLLTQAREEFAGFAALEAHVRAQLDEELTLEAVLGEAQAGHGVRAKDDLYTDSPDAPEGHEQITEIEGRGQADVEVVLDPKEDGEGADLPVHTFEKIETLEETSGLSRRTDDDDELEEHEEALQEIDMREVMRSPERPRSIYRSDIILDGLGIEVNEAAPTQGIPYPEWNYKKRDYREAWCFVQEKRTAQEDLDWLQRTREGQRPLVDRLKRQFASLTSELLQQRRQPYGDDFDLDALVDAQVALRSGRSPDERLYVDRRKQPHDVSALFLMDASFSTDGWVENRQVLDTIQQTVYCLSEVIDGEVESFALAAFSSNTRRACRFELVKDFHEPWQRVAPRLGSVKPEGYTRIGPALRHAHELLLNQNARRKLVLLITDGRPCDYDRYEGSYGVRDVRKAIETASQHGLHTHAFAIDKQAYEVFPQMFRHDHYNVLGSPEALSRHMSQLFVRVLAQ